MKPKVSVCITTYNHEKYIAQALDSALNQNVNFPYEILIGEDDSTDNTRKIVQEYAKAHPDKIRLLLNDRKDVIYINGKPSGRWNLINTINNAKGDFVALLDGDDYWSDPNKLSKQISYLEKNDDLSFCFTNATILKNNHVHDSSFCSFYKKEKPPERVKFKDFLFGHWAPTGSIVFKKDCLKIPKWYWHTPYGDWGLLLVLLQSKDGGFINEYPLVYRIHETNMFINSKIEEKHKNVILFFEEIRDKFDRDINLAVTKKLIQSYKYLSKISSKSGLKIKYFLKAINYQLKYLFV